ncbi:MAG: hypothetical protein KA155_08600 [Alphaproteobacteria bacterium]|jgi:hypothetical protein|nr:hypothetical protein [Alphaproteobacteria bacterium]
MAFEKRIGKDGSYLEDLDRNIILKKVIGGPDFAGYELKIDDDKFLIQLTVKTTKEGECWDLHTINFPKNYDPRRKDDITSIAKEAINAALDLFYKRTRSLLHLTYSIDQPN